MALLQGGQGGGHIQPDRLDHDYGLDADPVLWSEGCNKIPSMDPRCAWTFALDGLFIVERDYILREAIDFLQVKEIIAEAPCCNSKTNKSQQRDCRA